MSDRRGSHMWQTRNEYFFLNCCGVRRNGCIGRKNVQSSLHFCHKGRSEMMRRKFGTERSGAVSDHWVAGRLELEDPYSWWVWCVDGGKKRSGYRCFGTVGPFRFPVCTFLRSKRRMLGGARPRLRHQWQPDRAISIEIPCWGHLCNFYHAFLFIWYNIFVYSFRASRKKERTCRSSSPLTTFTFRNISLQWWHSAVISADSWCNLLTSWKKWSE